MIDGKLGWFGEFCVKLGLADLGGMSRLSARRARQHTVRSLKIVKMNFTTFMWLPRHDPRFRQMGSEHQPGSSHNSAAHRGEAGARLAF